MYERMCERMYERMCVGRCLSYPLYIGGTAGRVGDTVSSPLHAGLRELVPAAPAVQDVRHARVPQVAGGRHALQRVRSQEASRQPESARPR